MQSTPATLENLPAVFAPLATSRIFSNPAPGFVFKFYETDPTTIYYIDDDSGAIYARFYVIETVNTGKTDATGFFEVSPNTKTPYKKLDFKNENNEPTPLTNSRIFPIPDSDASAYIDAVFDAFAPYLN